MTGPSTSVTQLPGFQECFHVSMKDFCVVVLKSIAAVKMKEVNLLTQVTWIVSGRANPGIRVFCLENLVFCFRIQWKEVSCLGRLLVFCRLLSRNIHI